MTIFLNSKDLGDLKRGTIERYFQENFSFEGKTPRLVWKDDDSGFIMLGFSHGKSDKESITPITRDARSAPVVMFKVHESELLRIAGHRNLSLVRTEVD